jgi:dihydrofolate reductase
VIRAILACDDDWGIGKNRDLPWPHNPADLKWFKEKTSGSVVVMGGETWRSLPRKPLPNRENVVITRRDDIEADVVVDMKSALKILPQMNFTNDIWIIGGAQIVKSLLPYIDEFWLSRIQGTYDCDTFLPRTLIEEQYTLVSSEFDSEVYVDIWRKR